MGLVQDDNWTHSPPPTDTKSTATFRTISFEKKQGWLSNDYTLANEKSTLTQVGKAGTQPCYKPHPPVWGSTILRELKTQIFFLRSEGFVPHMRIPTFKTYTRDEPSKHQVLKTNRAPVHQIHKTVAIWELALKVLMCSDSPTPGRRAEEANRGFKWKRLICLY